jgi:PhnB protein
MKMAEKVKAIPDGLHTVTPAMIARDAQKALDFYKQAFGATIMGVAKGPGGKVMHAEFRIGDSAIMLADEFPEYGSHSPQSPGGGISMSIYLYVEDADATFQQAVNAGAKPAMPMSDMFWGDRFGQVMDPFGHRWSIATRVRNLTPEEIAKAQKEFFDKQPKP